MVSIPFNGPFSPLRNVFIRFTSTVKPVDAKKSRYLVTVVLTVENRSKEAVKYDGGTVMTFTTGRGRASAKLPAGSIKPGKAVSSSGGYLKPGEDYALSVVLRRSWWKVGSSVSGRAPA